ncbi:hypothetical protein MPTK1_5g01110 [Marchantia polymorpha subsp. ruderalis]|uniref:Uncharacterized protein n=2 Tax=Marchantia polymorpha TaxID=3197 RepID=A0AAF6BDM7_MARPO|nr:hypothetical protein MARPO_0197s0005 [Marchantia polymorpha]BBN10111.1 hypothetical protein Mp_5g01110 [Marchantia polymorpha subsp. ruderalis]|eukprot:PTQ27453.1 hypothetical protein MARPO_0197s0005 [Marchantia polymorpha]
MGAREFQWSADLLDIKQVIKDPITCAWGTFCPCVLFGRNVNRITDGQTSFMKGCLTEFAMGGCLCWCCCLPFYAAPFREQLRRKKNLPMDPYSDLHTHMFCHPCALCQEERILDATESSAMSAPTHPVINRHPPETAIHVEELKKTLNEKMTRNNSF